jgi:uridine kinase
MKRTLLIHKVASLILGIQLSHPTRVAVDGVDGAGKTILADELAAVLAHQPRQIIRASVDGFHQPEPMRRARGALSPEGFYQDSYNYEALKSELLLPLGPEGSRQFRRTIFDYERDQPITVRQEKAAKNAILLMDGIFLLRKALIDFWDLRLFLHVDFAQSVPRGAARDADLFGSLEKAEQRYHQRYVPGQKIYLKESNPLDKADVVIDNNNIKQPKLIRCPGWPQLSSEDDP